MKILDKMENVLDLACKTKTHKIPSCHYPSTHDDSVLIISQGVKTFIM